MLKFHPVECKAAINTNYSLLTPRTIKMVKRGRLLNQTGFGKVVLRLDLQCLFLEFMLMAHLEV